FQRGFAHDQLAHLPADSRGRELPPKSHAPGRAESAAQGAARLRRDAERATFPFGDQHRFDRFAVVQRPEKFLGSVPRLLMQAKRQSPQRQRLIERATERRGKVCDIGPARHGTPPQPGKHLPHAIRRFATLREPLLEGRPRGVRSKTQEVDAHRNRASTPTRYAEPRSFTPASRASVMRYFPIATRSPATGRQRTLLP